MKVFHNLQALLEHGRKQAETVETVSFDLFDTLLVRRIHDPDLIKWPVARYISEKARGMGIPVSAEYVQEVRDAREHEQRRQTAESFSDHEACYPVFMEQALAEIFGERLPPSMLEEVTNYELALENAMLVPRQPLADWVRELHGAQKRVFVVSDVYLPADFLRELLRHAGLLEFVEEVVSSADTFLAKASGEAFPLLERRYGLNPESWLHVGDNPISDGIRPHEYGITALVIDDDAEKQRKAIVRRHLNYGKGKPFWRGRALQQLMLPLEGENRPQSELYVEGYNFLGPLIGIFIQRLVEQCLELGVEKIFFLSREGYTFKKFWERALPLLRPLHQFADSEYLYVSRMALAGASCAYQGLTRTNADIVFLPAGNKDFRDICRVFDLQVEPLEPFLARHRLTSSSVLSPLHEGYSAENTSRYHAMLEDGEFQEEVRRQTLPANTALQRYLDDLGFFEAEHVALVDIGWLGTIPRFLYEAVRHREPHPTCHNFLFGATRGIEYPVSDKNRLYGLIYDKDRFDFAASTIVYSRDLFEEACKAPHPTLNRYRLSGDSYELEFRNTEDALGEAEKNQDSYFAPLQQGVEDAARRFGAASAVLGYGSTDYKPWLNYLLVEKMAFPRTREVRNIRHRHHLDDFHGTHEPSRAFRKGTRRQLWEYPLQMLRWVPFLRIKCFLRHLRERLNE